MSPVVDAPGRQAHLCETHRRYQAYLEIHLGVRVEYIELPDDIGYLDAPNRTLFVDIGSTMAEQARLLSETLNLICAGPEAAPGAIPERCPLRVVG